MRCSECGSENRDTARFCGRCWPKLDRPCPRCQAENPPRNEFCHACRRYIEKGIELQNAIEAKILLSYLHFCQGMNRFEAGDPTTALSHLEKARELAQQNHERWVEAAARIGFGEVLAKIDPAQRATAKQEILEGIRMAEELRLAPLASWGRVALGEG